VSRFTLEAPGPDPSKIPSEDLLETTICLVSCAYRDKEFLRVGYWVSKTFLEPVAEGQELPKPLPIEKIERTIHSEKPRVTRWTIPWD
jgi:histone chaperone ASF1